MNDARTDPELYADAPELHRACFCAPAGYTDRVSLTPEKERWAEALLIEQQHGASAPMWIAERIGALATAGDEAGVERFRAIAACYDQLLATRSPS